jgi:hypothetical protein
MSAPARNTAPILNSWKEIANFLGRGVRTVQRWEAEAALPVHRIGKGKRSPVFAFPSELILWTQTIQSDGHSARDLRHGADGHDGASHNPAINRSRRLIRESADLVRSLVLSTVKQREQAESLYKHVSALKLLRHVK